MKGDNVALKSGKLGDTVFYVLHGRQMARLRVRHIRNPRTEAQETQRTKMYNLCAMYRAMRGMLRYSFETRGENQSCYNAFVSMNLGRVGCYLSKDYRAFNACVAQPYMVSCGTIESVRMSRLAVERGRFFVTNLALGSLVIDDSTTVGEFAKALIDSNVGYLRRGDLLTFVSVAQVWREEEGCPFERGVPGVDVRYYGVVLDVNDSTLLSRCLPGYATLVCDGCLAVSGDAPRGGFCYMVSREDKLGRLHVSTQVLVDNGMMDCSTSEYRDKAVRSYHARRSYGGGSQSDAVLDGRSLAFGGRRDLIGRRCDCGPWGARGSSGARAVMPFGAFFGNGG